ncbi:hypothetical protein HW566_04705 [Microbacterium oleivorans]|uniref:Uncharacterized protein n=1 Tax=Microbacterium oleivorans TaxID=273677 RepID=A0A7D5EZE3_9MICO|nr:hypothetical protein HW566_04705 [Microbacterium oleivorans]
MPSAALPDPDSYTDLGPIAVDGETFTARRRDGDGSIHYAWTSGPNPGYGFSAFRGPGPVRPHEHETAIRDFLSGIDPETGYLSYP